MSAIESEEMNRPKEKMEEDLEDGELPEEGEISDDEEPTAAPSTQPPPVVSNGKISPERGASFSGRGRGGAGTFSPRRPVANKFDHDGKLAHERTGDRAIDAWGAKVGGSGTNGNGTSPPQEDPFGDRDQDYRSPGQDKDYRNPFDDDSADFGDTDYRMDRRRRRSPTPESGDFERPFKRMRGGFARGGGRGGRRFFTDTTHVICKFYREGFCRDADNCAFSHLAEDSLRKPELCKFYQNGFCKKGLHCSNLHGEFPCMAFHRAECQAENCGYSHLPLTDYTRPIVERYADEFERWRHSTGQASVSQPSVEVPHPAQPPRFPGGTFIPRPPPPTPYGLPMPPGHPAGPVIGVPISAAPHLNQAPSPPPSGVSSAAAAAAAAAAALIAARRRVLLPAGPSAPPTNPAMTSGMSPDQVGPGGLPPPSVVVPQLARGGPGFSPNNGYRSPYYGPPQTAPVSVAPSRMLPEEPPKPSTGFNITQMLAQFSGAGVKKEEESPASPPGSVSFSARSVEPREIVWRLVPVDTPPTYSTVDPQVASSCSQADPRLPKLLSSQFDAVSSLISCAPTTSAPSGAIPPPKLVDPRLADPRVRSGSSSGSDPRRGSWMPQISS